MKPCREKQGRETPSRKSPAVALLVLLASMAGPAGLVPDASAGGGRQRLENIFQEVEEVHVVNLDVMVTDKDGNPVTGLTAEDFEVREDGRPVTVTNFYAVEGGEPVRLEPDAVAPGAGGAEETGAAPASPTPAPPPPSEADLHLVVYFDNANIAPTHRERVLELLRRHLGEQWRPGMEVTLVSNERGVTIRQAPTGRRDLLLAALDDLGTSASRSARLDRDLQNLLRAMERINVDQGNPSLGVRGGPPGVGPEEREDLFGAGAAEREQEEMTARVAAEAVALVPQMSAYSQVRSDEVRASLTVLERLIGSVAGLPGRKAVLYVSDGLSMNPAEALFEAFDQRFAALGPIPAIAAMRSESARFDLTPHFQQLAATANASRVSFYTLDASPPSVVTRGGADRESNFVSTEFTSTEERNEQESLQLLAESTGGMASFSSATLDQVMERFFRDFDNYYSLGCAAEPGQGVRDLEVRLRGENSRLTVRHRASVQEKTADQQMVDRTLSALLLESLDNPLDVSLEAETLEPAEEGTFLVPVIVKIPLGKLVLLPGAREHQARVSLFIAVRDERGRTSEVVQQLCPIRVPNTELLVALGRQAGCGVRLRMRPGEQRVAVGVRDDIASVASAVQLKLEVEAPAAAEGAAGGAAREPAAGKESR